MSRGELEYVGVRCCGYRGCDCVRDIIGVLSRYGVLVVKVVWQRGYDIVLRECNIHVTIFVT